MQKKLIALAIAGAFAAPAFAATSNVDVYGSINLSIENVDNGSSATAGDWARMVSNNNSFIGFKGSEDLGGGLSAVWQIEANLEMSGDGTNAATSGATNTGTYGNIYGTRNTYIGLSSKTLGTVLAGVHDTPYKMATGSLDVFVGTLGDYNAIMGNAAGNPSTVFDLRTGNTIAYVSPNWGGFDVKAAYVMGLEGVENAASNRASAYSLSATYANGPLFVTAAYEKHNDLGVGTAITGATVLTQGTADRDAWKVGIGYKIGDLKLGAIYESIDGDGSNSTIEHDSWMVNAAYTMGAFTFKAEYLSAGELNNVNNTDADMWALGVDYALSKRTTIQLTYADLNNATAAGWDLGQGPQVTNAAAGDDVSGYSIGVKHTF